jgi:hypothetical protein
MLVTMLVIVKRGTGTRDAGDALGHDCSITIRPIRKQLFRMRATDPPAKAGLAE